MKLFGSNCKVLKIHIFVKMFVFLFICIGGYVFLTPTIFSQSACASITSVQASNNKITVKAPFKCNVQVSPQFAESETIACGIRINGEFPADICPSDEFFGGWQGNTAQFNCVYPYDFIEKNSTLELVAFDFREACGPGTGKAVALDATALPVKQLPDSQTPSPSKDTPSPTPLPKSLALNILRLFFNFSNKPGQSTPQQPVNSPSLTPKPAQPSIIPSQSTSPSPHQSFLPSRTYPGALSALVQPCVNNKNIYEQAEIITGVPWYVLAGIHYREGSCGANKSLVSGRVLGTNEPDIYGNCSSQYSGNGIPVPLPGGGCGFYTLLDTAIYAANHLKGKIGKNPSTFPELTMALSRYNGGGNSNCGKTPYANCPRAHYGEDDTYVMNKFDQSHTPMYIVYCADYTLCNPPVQDSRPGTATAANILFINSIQ